MEVNLKNFIIFILIACQSVFAVPSLINYQGRLTDPNGDALTGNKIMSVSIYDAATEGTSLYTEEVGIISLDSNGIYSFSFGTNQTALTSALQTTGEHWLELTVDGTSQTPRERILSVPFAQVAGSLTQNLQDQIDSLNDSIGQILMQNQAVIRSLEVNTSGNRDEPIVDLSEFSTSRVWKSAEGLYLCSPTNVWSRSEEFNNISNFEVGYKVRFLYTMRVWRVNFLYEDGTSAYSLTAEGENIFNRPSSPPVEYMVINPFPEKVVERIQGVDRNDEYNFYRNVLYKINEEYIEFFNFPEELSNDHYVHLSVNKNNYFNESDNFDVTLIGTNGEQIIPVGEVVLIDSGIGAISQVKARIYHNDLPSSPSLEYLKMLDQRPGYDFYDVGLGIENFVLRLIPSGE